MAILYLIKYILAGKLKDRKWDIGKELYGEKYRFFSSFNDAKMQEDLNHKLFFAPMCLSRL